MDPHPPTDRPPTDRTLTGRSERERRARVVAAGHRGDASVVADGLIDADATVRSAAIGAIVRLATAGVIRPSESATAIVAGLGDPDPSVRRRASEEAGRWGAAEVAEAWGIPDDQLSGRAAQDLVATLRLCLDDDDHRVAEVAAFALGEVPSAGDDRRCAVDDLSRVATIHPDHLCRESAVAAIGSIGDPAGLGAVLRCCDDRANVRRRAVLALAAFDDPEATEALRRLLDDRDLQVRQAAEELLAIESGEDT